MLWRSAPGGTDCAVVLAPRVAPPNSLRELRSLRSAIVGESEDDARTCGARRPSSLRSSPPQKSPRAGTACRDAALVVFGEGSPCRWAKVGSGRFGRACEAPRSAGLRGWPDGPKAGGSARTGRAPSAVAPRQGRRARARASSAAALGDRASQGSRPQADRLSEAPGPARAHLRLAPKMARGRSLANVRSGPLAVVGCACGAAPRGWR